MDLVTLSIAKQALRYGESQLDTAGTIPVHRPIMCHIPTYDGYNQTVHPAVVYIPDGLGAQKWRYWMAVTPYRLSSDDLENPSIYASHDGVIWDIPDGLTNPVAPIPSDLTKEWNSDPDLLWHDNQLWLFYRLSNSSTNVTVVKLQTSGDGVTWSVPSDVITVDTGTGKLASPAVIYRGSQFEMYYTKDPGTGTAKLCRRTSADGYTWGAEIELTCGAFQSGYLWHVDVIENHGRLEGIFQSAIAAGGDGLLQFAYSEDGGATWTVKTPFMQPTYTWEHERHYRATFTPIPGRSDMYDMWYSGRSELIGGSHRWNTAYLPVKLVNNQLYPIGPTPWETPTWHRMVAPTAAFGALAAGVCTAESLSIQNQPQVQFLKTGSQTLTVAALSSEILDLGTAANMVDFDYASYQITPRISGLYLICGSLLFGSVGSGLTVYLQIHVDNSSTLSLSLGRMTATVASQNVQLNGSGLLLLKAGKVLDMRARVSGGPYPTVSGAVLQLIKVA
jgi:hypothetical protein